MNTFNFLGRDLRTIILDREPWFVAKDVCRAIGIVNVGNVTAALESDQKAVQTLDTPGGPQRTAIISESGLFSALMRAQRKRPEVVEFQNWVTREVLPAIRKTGGYLLNEGKREEAFADTKEEMPVVGEMMAALTALRAILPSPIGVSSRAQWPREVRQRPPRHATCSRSKHEVHGSAVRPAHQDSNNFDAGGAEGPAGISMYPEGSTRVPCAEMSPSRYILTSLLCRWRFDGHSSTRRSRS